MRQSASLLLLAACARLPSTPAAMRSADAQGRLVVPILVGCGDTTAFYGTDPWVRASRGTAVILDELHMATAAHVVACPELPEVMAFMPDGSQRRMIVDHDDRMFGAGRDVARLVHSSSGLLDAGAAPAVLGTPTFDGAWWGCEVTVHGRSCGYITPPPTRDEDFAMEGGIIRAGDSGAPFYDSSGRLLGIATKAFSSIVDGHRTEDGFVEIPADYVGKPGER